MSVVGGVDVGTVVRWVQQRGYIGEVTRDPGPVNAILYGSTREFLERRGLDDIGQLPPLGEFVPGPEVVEARERGLRSDPEVEEAVAMAADGSTEGSLADADGAAAPEGGAVAASSGEGERLQKVLARVGRGPFLIHIRRFRRRRRARSGEQPIEHTAQKLSTTIHTTTTS